MNLVNIAMSGLNSNRVALDVTAQNVSNINTPGYSRQQALMASVAGAKHDNFSAGQGVEVTSIRRVTDDFLIKQTWATQSQSAYASRYSTNMSQLENTLGADGFSLSAGLDTLFSALNDATVKPESVPYRQQIINEAEALARRFNTLTESLSHQHKDMNDQRNAGIAHANSLMSNIADINKQIVETKGTGGNPAQLLDTCDNLIGELSKVVTIKTTNQADGSLQVTLSSGQPLVMGADAAQLKATPDHSDPYLATVQVEFGEQSFATTGALGGQIGALSDYQTEVLKPYLGAIDDMARSLADEFNDLLVTGQDLNRDNGKPLFTYDSANPAASLNITELKPEQLALSADGNPGNADVLDSLITVSNKNVPISGFGSVSLNDAFSAIVGETAIQARQANADDQAKLAMKQQAVAARDNVSAVNSDEEAANLMTFSHAHQANMKVISTANQLFEVTLNLF